MQKCVIKRSFRNGHSGPHVNFCMAKRKKLSIVITNNWQKLVRRRRWGPERTLLCYWSIVRRQATSTSATMTGHGAFQCVHHSCTGGLSFQAQCSASVERVAKVPLVLLENLCFAVVEYLRIDPWKAAQRTRQLTTHTRRKRKWTPFCY